MDCKQLLLVLEFLSIAACNPKVSQPIEPDAAVEDASVASSAPTARPGYGYFLPDGALRRPPQLKYDRVLVRGSADAEAVRKSVRMRYGKHRLCYEVGLKTSRALAGKVVARFTIAKNGTVSDVKDLGSDLPDKSVVACVLEAYSQLQAPLDGGTASVTATVSFAPGDCFGPGCD